MDERKDTKFVQYYRLDEALPPEVIALFNQYEQTHFQHGLDWYRLLAETSVDSKEEAFVVVSHRGAQEIAALVLVASRDKSRIRSLSNFYTASYAPLIQAESKELVLGALFEQLRVDFPRAELRLEPLFESRELFAILLSTLRESGWLSSHSYHRFDSCFLSRTKDYEWGTYFDGRPSRVQNTIKRKSKSLEKKKDISMRYFLHDEISVDDAVALYEEVYLDSWKQDEPWPEFMPKFMEYLIQKKWLLIAFVLKGSEPLAVQLWIKQSQTAFIFKLAHKQQETKSSYGTLLLSTLLRFVLRDASIREVDFMQGREPYKMDWMDGVRQYYGIAAYSSPITLLFFQIRQLLAKMRRGRAD